jgi:hypothetical protein
MIRQRSFFRTPHKRNWRGWQKVSVASLITEPPSRHQQLLQSFSALSTRVSAAVLTRSCPSAFETYRA